MQWIRVAALAVVGLAACKREEPTPVVVNIEQPAAEPSAPPAPRARPAPEPEVTVPTTVVVPPPVTLQPKPLDELTVKQPLPTTTAPTALPADPTYAPPSLPPRQNSGGATSQGAGATTGGLIGSSTAGTTSVCTRVGPCYEALARDLCQANQTACRAALQPPAVNEDATFCSDQLRKAPEQARPYMIDKPGYRLPGECG